MSEDDVEELVEIFTILITQLFENLELRVPLRTRETLHLHAPIVGVEELFHFEEEFKEVRDDLVTVSAHPLRVSTAKVDDGRESDTEGVRVILAILLGDFLCDGVRGGEEEGRGRGCEGMWRGESRRGEMRRERKNEYQREN